MSDLTLVIGNKNYSSWSLRAWLTLRQTNLAVDHRRRRTVIERGRHGESQSC